MSYHVGQNIFLIDRMGYVRKLEVSLYPRRALGLTNQLKEILQNTHYTDIDSKLLSLDMQEEWEKVCSKIPY